jgi:hypothetical protein
MATFTITFNPDGSAGLGGALAFLPACPKCGAPMSVIVMDLNPLVLWANCGDMDCRLGLGLADYRKVKAAFAGLKDVAEALRTLRDRLEAGEIDGPAFRAGRKGELARKMAADAVIADKTVSRCGGKKGNGT